MNPVKPINPDDEWLAAMQGKAAAESKKSGAWIEGELLRTAVHARVSRHEAQYSPSESGFRRLEERAEHLGLIKAQLPHSESDLLTLEGLARRLSKLLPMPFPSSSSERGVISPAHLLANTFSADAAFAVRGEEASRVILRVANCAAVANVWQRALLDAHVDHATLLDEEGRVLIQFELTQAAIDLLTEKRVQAPAGQWCTLVIEPDR